MAEAPCRNCASRAVGCHAGCEEYKAYDAARKEECEARRVACLEATTSLRNHKRWMNEQRRKPK